jgi:hypothetical protein
MNAESAKRRRLVQVRDANRPRRFGILEADGFVDSHRFALVA